MVERLLELFSGLPPALTTFLLAALPVTELRAAIPIGAAFPHFSVWDAFFWAVLGNCVPIALVYLIMPRLQEWLSCRSSRPCQWYRRFTERLRERNQDAVHRWGALALCLFVAVPLPGTGAWTGSLLAVLFKIPPRWGIPAIAAGVVIAGLIVTLIVAGVVTGFDFLVG